MCMYLRTQQRELIMTTPQGNEDIKKAELRKRIEYQVACEERAHRIVERLIDNPITEQMLCDSLQYVTPSHYSDIVEERAVSKLCGYPVCPNNLGNVPKQKYMISTKTNKVYDLEARKNFCSAKCYKASIHLEKQVSSTAVWSRRNLPPVKFDLLPLDGKIGKLGDEVFVSKAAEIKEDVKKLEKLDKYYEELERKKQEKLKNKQSNATKVTKPLTDDTTDSVNEDNDGVSDLSKGLERVKIAEKCDKHDSIEQTEEVCVDSRSGLCNTNKEDTKHDFSGNKQAEPSSVKVKTSNKNPGKVSDKSTSVDKSKTDYLMQLLDRRKALLSKMADDQTNVNVSSTDKQTTQNTDMNEIVSDTDSQSKEVSKMLNKPKITAEDKTESSKVEQTHLVNRTKNIEELSNERVQSAEDALPNSQQGQVIEHQFVDKTKSKHNKEIPDELVKNVDKVLPDSKHGKVAESRTNIKLTKKKVKKSAVSFSTVELLCEGIRCWITKETGEYLKDNNEEEVDNNDGVKLGKPEYEKQYKALVAKVDAQEKDFDALLGEESMTSEYEEKAMAPLPHFDVLKEEMSADQKRVQEFMKGSFVYKVTEKTVNVKSDNKDPGVVLPTVDRYDQLVIRQKIVLERVSKVLPDVLSPLHLLGQEVFTELRELICTFNLTSENILYKPAEWTIVTIIILRMLSKKLQILQGSFDKPGAERYFTTLLSGISGSLQQIDAQICKMFVQNEDKL